LVFNKKWKYFIPEHSSYYASDGQSLDKLNPIL